MKTCKILAAACLLFAVTTTRTCFGQDIPSWVRIERGNDGYFLLRDGKRFLIKARVAHASTRRACSRPEGTRFDNGLQIGRL